MNQIKLWLEQIGLEYINIDIASSDASFRSYYRIFANNDRYILMDSSLQKESLLLFLDINQKLSAFGVRVPQIKEFSLDFGYMLLEDFGSNHLLDVLSVNNQKVFYKKAIDEIILMQSVDTTDISIYDKEFLLFEMNLCIEWYLEKHMGIFLDYKQKKLLNEVFDFIADEVLAQPQGVFVHRDFHSKNIMIDGYSKIGIIDFQDAKSGGITYDLVSLLKDCYVEIDSKSRIELVDYFAKSKNLNFDDVVQWLDMTGLQRHIKILGIFARLYHRDNKKNYLKYIPLTLKYIQEVTAKNKKMEFLNSILKIG